MLENKKQIYLKTRENIALVVMLVDIRHTPSANDRMMYDWIVDNGMMPVIIPMLVFILTHFLTRRTTSMSPATAAR